MMVLRPGIGVKMIRTTLAEGSCGPSYRFSSYLTRSASKLGLPCSGRQRGSILSQGTLIHPCREIRYSSCQERLTSRPSIC